MIVVHNLLETIVNQLSTKLDSQEKEKEVDTYFINTKISVLSRYSSSSGLDSRILKNIEEINEGKDSKNKTKINDSPNIKKVDDKKKV